MKNNIKKIIVGILSFAVLLSTQSVFAGSVTWNTASNDCKSLSIINSTTLEGYQNPCWPLSTVSADKGENIGIRIYYHNTGTVTATNTHVMLIPTTSLSSSSNKKVFTARITSDQGSVSISQPVTVNISSSQSLSLSSVKWYVGNPTQTLTPLKGSQSSILTDQGLPIGDIAPGWASQGSVVVTFKISSNIAPAPACVINNFTASSTSITKGDSTNLSWSTSNCASVTLSNVGNVNPSGSQTVHPTANTTYLLTGTDSSGKPTTKSIMIYVTQPAACVVNSFTNLPTSIIAGDTSVLSWNTSNCTSVSISNIGNVASSGTQVVSPTATTTYTITAKNSSNTAETKSVTVYVNQPATCSINSFTASPESITAGNSSTLSWSTVNCGSVSISPNIGTYTTSYGSKTVYPTSTTIYTAKAYNFNGVLSDTENVTITVNAIPSVMTGSLSASSSSCVIASGNSTCSIPFSWTTQNPEATSAVTHDGATVATGNNGSKTLSISNGSQTYYLYNNSKLLDTAIVNASCASGSNWNGSYCAPVVINNCSINSFTASLTSITSGEFSVLSWSTTNCNSVNISNIGSVSASSSKLVYPTATTTYTITAVGSNGSTQVSNVTVYVNQPATCSINSFTASPTYITSGSSSVLNWNTSDCTNVTISNIGYNVPVSGSQAVWPTSTKTYTLVTYGSNGQTQTRSVTVSVDDYNNNQCVISDFSADDTSIEEGDSVVLRWNTNDCDHVTISRIGNVSLDGSKRVYPTSDTTYVLTAYNTNGSTETESIRIYVDENNNNNNNCYIDSFTTNKIYVNSDESVTLRWNTTGCYNVNISGLGNVSLDGSQTVYPASTRTYTLNAYGNNSQSRSITVNVNYNPIVTPVTPVYNSSVVTTVATNISQTGAQLNGLVTSSNYNNSNVYFEYGTTVNMGLRTSSHSTNGNTNFSDYVSGLSANTIYFFQAVSEGTNGVSRGAIEIFKTLGYQTTTTPTKTVVVQGPTVSSSTSPIMLRIENKYQTIGIGDIVDYTVYYKNISSSKLTNPMVQVFVPKGITLLNISRGTYSESDKTLSVPIEDLNPGAEGVIYLQGRVDDMDTNLAQIVTTAILIYTNPNGAQENAMAYVLNNPKVINLLGASAFFGNMFGMSLIGWLILILIILILILIARSLLNRGSGSSTYTPSH